MSALPRPLPNGTGGDAEPVGGLFHCRDKVMIGGHDADSNVIFHTLQRESSHSPDASAPGKTPGMEESEIFRVNLLAAMRAAGLRAAELSKLAKLNARAVKDIEERRTVSHKLSTVFALSKALGRDPAEMMGLGSRPRLNKRLTDFLAQYSEADQERFLSALELLTPDR